MRTSLRSVYGALPAGLQDLVFTTWGFKTRAERFGPEFRRRLDWLREAEWWDAAEVERYQADQVRRIVAHAYETVPAYRRLWQTAGLTPADIQAPDDLSKLPIITKRQVRLDPDAFLSRSFAGKRLRTSLTSGTTGTPLAVRLTPEALQFQWAVWWRHRARFGLRLGDRHLTFGARLPVPIAVDRPPYWRHNRAINQVYLATYHITPASARSIVDWLNEEDFAFYTGYPSAMFALASLLRAHDLPFRSPPSWLVTGSDALLPAFERSIAEEFRAPVTDQYGSAEACGNFARCPAGRYHLDAEFCRVELLPVPGADEPRLRRLVFTGFANPAMPFVRYDLGDLGLVAEGPCPCGRQTLTLERIEGRTEDFVRTPDGRMAIGMNQVFEWAPHLLEAQIRQDSLDRVDVLVVPAAGYGRSDERVLEAELRARLGTEIAIAFHLVSEIPRAKNGKFRAVVSTLEVDSAEEQELRAAVRDGVL